jgi:hypothetical protein
MNGIVSSKRRATVLLMIIALSLSAIIVYNSPEYVYFTKVKPFVARIDSALYKGQKYSDFCNTLINTFGFTREDINPWPKKTSERTIIVVFRTGIAHSFGVEDGPEDHGVRITAEFDAKQRLIVWKIRNSRRTG